MKKILITITIFICIFALIINFYKLNKCKDINYSLDNYFTTGILNEYKLCDITNKNITFSNGTLTVFKLEGLNAKGTHKKMFYNVFVEKNSKGIWKIKKVYILDE